MVPGFQENFHSTLKRSGNQRGAYDVNYGRWPASGWAEADRHRQFSEQNPRRRWMPTTVIKVQPLPMQLIKRHGW